MGLFNSKQKKIQKIVNRANAEAQRKAINSGGRCSNCREYDPIRGVCTGPVTMGGKQAGHVTSPNSVCPHWRV